MSGDVELLYAIKDLVSPWTPPDNAEPLVHTSINYCDEMDSHNKILDYDATVTGTPGETADTPLANIATHDFDTKWQAQAATPDDSQCFELELSGAVDVDYYIMNFHVPYPYRTTPYTPDMSCWKAWTLSGKQNEGDAWTTLETVTNNSIKVYRGTFTKGNYKYFRVSGISAYSDQAQTVRIDAYLYTMGLYDSAYRYIDRFPDPIRGRNDHNGDPEITNYTNHNIYINDIMFVIGDIYDMNGEITNVIKGETVRRHRHLGGLQSEFSEDSVRILCPNHLRMTRLNTLDFVTNSGICLYMFPPPDELWWFVNSAYAFDETTANMNTPIVLKRPDNAHKLTPVLTTIRTYTSYAVLGSRYTNTMSGEFKVNNYYISFSDNVNMDSQIRFDGQENEGLITDMDGTALTGCTNGIANVNVVRLKIGDIWRGCIGTLTFNPPIVLDGDDAAHLFEIRKNERAKGSVFRYVLHGFKVPKT
jgi:hypothetical protein